MTTRFMLIHFIILSLLAPAAGAQSTEPSSEDWRAFAERLDAGTLVTVHLKTGRHVTGHVIQVTESAMRLKPKTRIPAPISDVAFKDVMAVDVEKEGLSPGAKALIGAGVGAGLFMVFLGLAAARAD